jgi:arylsulfatase A-like enzyme
MYAACEAMLGTWLARATTDGFEYAPQSAISIALHALLCAAFGALAAASTTRWALSIARRVGTDPLAASASCATFAALLPVLWLQARDLEPGRAELRDTLVLSVVLLVTFAVAWTNARFARWLAGLASPWTAFVLVFTVPWLTVDALTAESWMTRRALVAVWMLLVLAVSTLLRARLESPAATGWAATSAALVLAFGGCIFGTDVLEQSLPRATVTSRTPVIFLSLDTVRSDHMSVYGYERDTTPRLREFAEGATRFARMYAAADFTLPSHASMFTGLYPREHDAIPVKDRAHALPLRREHVTLFERLQAAGWATEGVVSNFGYLGPEHGLAQGFERYDARVRRLAFPKVAHCTTRRLVHELLYEWLEPHEFDVMYRTAGEIDAALEERLAEHAARPDGRPLALFVNYMDAHMPYSPPEPWRSRFAAGVASVRKWDYYTWRARLYRGEMELADAQRDALLALYDASIAYLDSQVGELFDRLRRMDLYDRALIVVAADHGEEFGERGNLEHGMSVQLGELCVPLLVKLPGQREGRVVEDLASGVDVTPTVLAALGLPRPEPCSGRDLFAGSSGGRTVFAEHYPSSWHVRHAPGRAVHETAALWREFQFIRRDDGQLECWSIPPRGAATRSTSPSEGSEVLRELESWTERPRHRAEARERSPASLEALGYTQ